MEVTVNVKVKDVCNGQVMCREEKWKTQAKVRADE